MYRNKFILMKVNFEVIQAKYLELKNHSRLNLKQS